jgi:hypothetical protein
VAGVIEAKENILDEGFVAKLRAKATQAGQAIKKGISKVLGLFHASEGLVFLSNSLALVKRRFVGFHEAGHGFMLWQRKLYAFVEDCEKAIDGETAELFDREANTFASEVLFQLDAFHAKASDHPFEIWTPVGLSKEFGASVYSSVRQYVRKSHRACAVLVLNMPEMKSHCGFIATARRVETSAEFKRMFGKLKWAEQYTPDDRIGALVPIGTRKSSGKRSLSLMDSNNQVHDCVAESFSTTHQVFVLIHSVKTLTAVTMILP